MQLSLSKHAFDDKNKEFHLGVNLESLLYIAKLAQSLPEYIIQAILPSSLLKEMSKLICESASTNLMMGTFAFEMS
jgi:hypothetical protein